MAITHTNGPPDGVDAVRQGLARFAMPGDAISTDNSAAAVASVDAAARPVAGGPQVELFHAVYDLDATDVAKGGTLEAAEPIGFRYIVGAGTGQLSAAEVHGDATQSAASMTMTMQIYGPYAETLQKSLAQAEKLPAVASGTYELRVLHCRAIFLVALWLKGSKGAPDILWPLPPAPREFRPDHPYSSTEFLDIVRPLVQARIAAHEAFVEGKPYGD
jgi:hypothetical protein